MKQMPLLSDDKRCTKCRRWLPIDQFSQRMLRGKPYVTARCKLCAAKDDEASKLRRRRKVSATRKKWYRRNRQQVLTYMRERYVHMHRDRVAFVDWLKSAPCQDCGGTFPACCMDFDHRRDKVTDVSKMLRSKFTNEEVMLELAKCELVCANCHRIRTRVRKRGN